MLGSSASASPPPTTQFLGRGWGLGVGRCYRPPDLSTRTAVPCICTSPSPACYVAGSVRGSGNKAGNLDKALALEDHRFSGVGGRCSLVKATAASQITTSMCAYLLTLTEAEKETGCDAESASGSTLSGWEPPEDLSREVHSSPNLMRE